MWFYVLAIVLLPVAAAILSYALEHSQSIDEIEERLEPEPLERKRAA